MEAKKIYKNYRKEVIEYMDKLFSALTKQYGGVNDEWRISLDLIAYNYNLIVICRDDIEKNGMEKIDTKGRPVKNPSLSTLNQAQGYLLKLLSQFGLNILSKSRIKYEEVGTSNLDSLLA